MSGAGEAELAVAKELCEFEMAVERNVIAPMTVLLEVRSQMNMEKFIMNAIMMVQTDIYKHIRCIRF